jgi:hypothetical protein
MKGKRQGSAATRPRMTVVGVFDDHFLAGQAVRELYNAGFREKQINVALRHDPESTPEADLAATEDPYHHPDAQIDAGLGAPPGAGVRRMVNPGIEPGLLGRTFDSARSNPVTAGTASAGFVGRLVGVGVPEREAGYYRDEWEAGRTIITVASGGRSREAKAILRRHGSYDLLSGICTHAFP